MKSYQIVCEWVNLGGYSISKMACCGGTYTTDTVASRAKRVIVAIPSSIVTTVFFAASVAIGMVALPLIGLARKCQNKDDGGAYALAGLICVVLTGLVVSYLSLSAFGYIKKLTHSVAIFVGAIAICMTVKVYLALDDHSK